MMLKAPGACRRSRLAGACVGARTLAFRADRLASQECRPDAKQCCCCCAAPVGRPRGRSAAIDSAAKPAAISPGGGASRAWGPIRAADSSQLSQLKIQYQNQLQSQWLKGLEPGPELAGETGGPRPGARLPSLLWSGTWRLLSLESSFMNLRSWQEYLREDGGLMLG